MADLIIGIVLILIISGAFIYIIKAKKKGVKCIGCPAAGSCSEKKCDKNSQNSSYQFFENKNCEYFPCHEGLENFNCMFCYCPLYNRADCPGNPEYYDVDGKKIKACINCNFPHQPDNYEKIIELLK